MKIWRPQCLWTGLLLAVFTTTAVAADLAIRPLRVELSAASPITALTLTNRGDEAVVIQVTLQHWAMDGDEEIYADTDDLVATPPVFRMAPGAEQVIRIGLRGDPPVDAERAYRLFLDEVPPDVAIEEEAVRVTLRFGIPVFVQPAHPLQRAVEWRLVRHDDDRLRLVAENKGNAHHRFSRIDLEAPDGTSIASTEGLFYLLPGSRRQWELTATHTPEAGIYQLTARTSAEPVSAELTLR